MINLHKRQLCFTYTYFIMLSVYEILFLLRVYFECPVHASAGDIIGIFSKSYSSRHGGVFRQNLGKLVLVMLCFCVNILYLRYQRDFLLCETL